MSETVLVIVLDGRELRRPRGSGLEAFVAGRALRELGPHVYLDPALGVVAPLWSRRSDTFTVQIEELRTLLLENGRFLMDRRGEYRAVPVSEAMTLLRREEIAGSAFLSASKSAMWARGTEVEL